ncbi:hypothetical protein GCM10022238_12260 [Gordonia hankookensis]
MPAGGSEHRVWAMLPKLFERSGKILALGGRIITPPRTAFVRLDDFGLGRVTILGTPPNSYRELAVYLRFVRAGKGSCIQTNHGEFRWERWIMTHTVAWERSSREQTAHNDPSVG